MCWQSGGKGVRERDRERECARGYMCISKASSLGACVRACVWELRGIEECESGLSIKSARCFPGKQTSSSLSTSLYPTLSRCNIYHSGSRPSRLPWLPSGAAQSGVSLSLKSTPSQRAEASNLTWGPRRERRLRSLVLSARADAHSPGVNKAPPPSAPIHPLTENKWEKLSLRWWTHGLSSSRTMGLSSFLGR